MGFLLGRLATWPAHREAAPLRPAAALAFPFPARPPFFPIWRKYSLTACVGLVMGGCRRGERR
jgi:hypothetical protein